ncbi:unnamed protein product [Euphydryas editha]|uniref:Uncharacterized protein n=1 Tax=Euphydryas editha TaxID=104508 RepID=A0AAU9V0A2_EUPED|nr:unnamed protein product [Euphydryas editha]
MKRHSVSLLIILVATEAARYGDYSGARMPHYGIEYDNKDPAPLTDEYSDHSPDAAVSFDYKYEEEPRDKIDTQEPDSWHKTSKKRKTPLKAIEMDENEQEIIPKLKSNFRIQQHRTRNKDLHKKSGKRRYYSDINRNGDVDHVHDRNEYKLNKDRSREEDKIYLDNFDLRDTTRKLARRKPRDRTIRQEKLDEMGDDLLGFKEKESDDDTTVIVYEKERRMQTTEKIPRISIPGIKGKQTNNQEYDEYYDMKRVHNLKNKLPLLFRQTKASTTMTESPEMRHFQDLIYRRANIPEKVPSSTSTTPTGSTTLSTLVFAVTRTSTITEASTLKSSAELSLAEKSRQSILKKAQRKESLKNVTWTTKPPVLMHVTKKMHTLVMVEPQKHEPEFRARAVFDDSPERLARAKRLMRRKLVSGARSIQELIDNWDEMVCDYIDVSLLDNDVGHHVPSQFKIMLLKVVTVTSVAERELRALLGHRQRKEVSSPAGALPTTFPPNAVDPAFEDEWKTFIQNKSMSLKQTTIVSVILIINYLYGYGYSKFIILNFEVFVYLFISQP